MYRLAKKISSIADHPLQECIQRNQSTCHLNLRNTKKLCHYSPDMPDSLTPLLNLLVDLSVQFLQNVAC
jgi:hypothetical protein